MPDMNSLHTLATSALRLSERATSGPWQTLGDKDHSTVWAPIHNGFIAIAGAHTQGHIGADQADSNAAFIALSRTSLPLLAEAVVALLRYAQHLDNCGHTYWELCGEDPRGRCDCGLDAALGGIGGGCG